MLLCRQRRLVSLFPMLILYCCCYRSLFLLLTMGSSSYSDFKRIVAVGGQLFLLLTMVLMFAFEIIAQTMGKYLVSLLQLQLQKLAVPILQQLPIGTHQVKYMQVFPMYSYQYDSFARRSFERKETLTNRCCLPVSSLSSHIFFPYCILLLQQDDQF